MHMIFSFVNFIWPNSYGVPVPNDLGGNNGGMDRNVTSGPAALDSKSAAKLRDHFGAALNIKRENEMIKF